MKWVGKSFFCAVLVMSVLSFGSTDCSAFSLWEWLSSFESCNSEEAPEIGDLWLDSYGPDFIVINHEYTDDDIASAMENTKLKAYIGLKSEITTDGESVYNALDGPIDLTSGACRFDGLEKDATYRIIVTASNTVGSVSREMDPVRTEFKDSVVDPADYLEMSDEEIGQLKWALKLADDGLNDFSRIPSLDVLGIPLTGIMNLGFCSYRYSIAFYTYYLATVQYHKIPACQEIIKPRMDRLIQKMQKGPVWKYWALTSTGYFTFPMGPLDPDKQVFYPSERDPVRIKNIMYSGHLAHMIALYEKLYDDMKWCEDDAIEFKWNYKEKYTYTTHSLQKLLRDAFIDLPAHCIECEPNLCFAECNQHPVLALKVYDDVHGKDYYNDILDLQLDWYHENNIIDPETHDTSAMYLPLTGKTIGPGEGTWDLGNIVSLVSVPVTKLLNFRLAFAAADGWTMSFMHAWQKEYIEKHYYGENGDGGNRANRIDSETGRLKADVIWNDNLDVALVADQIGVPFYAMLAGELGDMDTRDALLEQCEDFYNPRWTWDGAYHYPVGPVDTIITLSSDNFIHFASSPTGALAGIARSNPKDGFYKLHGEPFPGAVGPIIEDVNINKTNLRRAVYDADNETLIVSTDTGRFGRDSDVESITVKRMDPDRVWHLKIDDTPIGSYKGVTDIIVDIPLDGPHDMILSAE